LEEENGYRLGNSFYDFSTQNSMKSFPDLFSFSYKVKVAGWVIKHSFEAVYTCPSRENVGPIDLSNFWRIYKFILNILFSCVCLDILQNCIIYFLEEWKRETEVSAHSFQFTIRYCYQKYIVY